LCPSYRPWCLRPRFIAIDWIETGTALSSTSRRAFALTAAAVLAPDLALNLDLWLWIWLWLIDQHSAA
jgi:hypothetical protein